MLDLLYGPTLTSIHDDWKTIAWTRWTFVGKIMSLLYNMLSRFVIAFLPRNIFFIFKLYKIVLVLLNIEMNPPQVYMGSPC